MNVSTLLFSFLACFALALFSFFVFPGHTYLTQDTQIYLPILENIWDATALHNDFLVDRSQVAFTLYDEYAIALRWLTRTNFRLVLEATQILCRALGIWGVFLLALPLVKNRWRALAVAAVCAAGAEVWGPSVLVVEFEPSPRAFALPLLFLAAGLTAQRRFHWAAAVACLGFLLHPTTMAPFWLVLILQRQWRIGFVSLTLAVAALALAAHFQPGTGDHRIFSGRIDPALEPILRLRGAYNWVGLWIGNEWPKYLACFAVGTAAYLRVRSRITPEVKPVLVALPLLGLFSVPVSYVLLDCLKWSLIPQVQPARLLLFVVAIPIFLAATAAFSATRAWEAPLWLALSLTPAAVAPRPRILPSPALTQLITWASSHTSKDAVFLFPEAGKSLEPGLFRAEALRAVYVDWKGGGQANLVPGFGLEWWRRYQDTMQKSHPNAYYRSLGINYVVRPGHPYLVQKVQ